jgi:hypothetical protein
MDGGLRVARHVAVTGAELVAVWSKHKKKLVNNNTVRGSITKFWQSALTKLPKPSGRECSRAVVSAQNQTNQKQQ